MTTSNVPPLLSREAPRGPEAKPAAARLSLDGAIKPNEGDKLPSLNRLNNPDVAVDSFADKNSARLVNTNAGFFSGGDGTANAAIGVGVNNKAVTFTIGSVISNELLQSVEQTRSSLVEEGISFIDEGIVDAQEATLEKERVENLQKGFNSFDDVSLRRRSENDARKESALILPRFFEDRSHLIFYSPQVKFVLPFFENPTISERRSSVYSTLTQTGLSPVITFQYANLAEIKINFKLNFLHILNVLKSENLDVNAFSFVSKTDTTQNLADVDKFFTRDSSNQKTSTTIQKLINILTKEESKFLEKFQTVRDEKTLNTLISFQELNQGRKADDEEILIQGNQYREHSFSYLKAQALCLMWVNVIKSWVFGSGTTDIGKLIQELQKDLELGSGSFKPGNTILSKFIIIKHGPMFYYIPGVLTSYEIKEVTNTPYDIHTLMAYGYDITLTITAKPENYQKVINETGDTAAYNNIFPTKSLYTEAAPIIPQSN